jgi:hypothetical protein
MTSSLQYIRSSPAAPFTTPPQAGIGSLTLQSLLFGVQIGLDTSSNFAYTVYGLAVRTANGRFVIKEHDRERLIDVTALTLPVNPLVYRVPVRHDCLEQGDLIVTSDPPNFCARYILTKHHDPWAYRGLDTGTAQITEFSSPENPFLDFYVRVISLLEVLAG